MDAAHYVPPPFPIRQPQPPIFQETPPPATPVLEEPNWLAARIPFLRRRVEARNLRVQADHAAREQAWAVQDQKAQAAYAQAVLRWEQDMKDWEGAMAAFDADQMERQRMLTAPEPADLSAVADYLRSRIAAIPWPRPVAASVTVAGQGDTVSISAETPDENAPQALWPSRVTTVNYERLRLYTKDKLKRDIRAEFGVHVQSLAFRLVGEVFGVYPAADAVMVEVLTKDSISGKRKLELRLVLRRAQWAGLYRTQPQSQELAGALAPFRC
jgi:hypothetical protein